MENKFKLDVGGDRSITLCLTKENMLSILIRKLKRVLNTEN